jgi:flagellar basal-body rod protein FlgB
MAGSLFTDTFRLLGKAMNVTAERHGLITTNLSNVDTVGYTPRDLDFQKTLQKEMAKQPAVVSATHPKHFRLGRGYAAVEAAKNLHGGGKGFDGVDIDTEMTNLVENNVQYRTSVELLLRKMNQLKYAITEGGK